MASKSAASTSSALSKAADTLVILTAEKLKRLYSTMLQSRMVKEAAATLSRNHSYSFRQEAAEVGSAIHLHAGDYIAPGRHQVIGRFLKGAPLADVFAPLSPRANHENHSGASPVAEVITAETGQVNIAIGVALACKMQKTGSVVVAFAENAAAEPGWRESLRFAAGYKLPILFVVQESSHAEKRNKDGSYILPMVPVDGVDVVAVYRVAEEAIRRAREGHGPAVIRCASYLCDDCPEINRPSDPLTFMENYLKRKDLWSDEWKQKLITDFRKELEAATRPLKRPGRKRA